MDKRPSDQSHADKVDVPTPRTDAIFAEISTFFDTFRKVDRMLLDHSRRLERELGAYKKAWGDQVLHVACAASGCQYARSAGTRIGRRQYYYRVTACKADFSQDQGCICWHYEGTGPLSVEEQKDAPSWREAPQSASERTDDARLLWLETLLKHCPHADLTWNDDADEGPLGWRLLVESCSRLDLRAPTLEALIDLGMKSEPDEDGDVVANATDAVPDSRGVK